MYETKFVRNEILNRCFYCQKSRESIYDLLTFAVSINLWTPIEQTKRVWKFSLPVDRILDADYAASACETK